MATGKTAVGRLLAARLARRFVDTDREVERDSGMSVAEIFRRFGEPEFRARELATIGRIAAEHGVVAATGGGAVLDLRNRATMRSSGRIVCLTASADVILLRVGTGADRPLLARAADRRQRVLELLDCRAPAYADSDWTVDTSAQSPEEVARSIVEWLERTAG
jgi:shikimate kinase